MRAAQALTACALSLIANPTMAGSEAPAAHLPPPWSTAPVMSWGARVPYPFEPQDLHLGDRHLIIAEPVSPLYVLSDLALPEAKLALLDELEAQWSESAIFVSLPSAPTHPFRLRPGAQ